MLVPAAEQDPAAGIRIIAPGLFILNGQAKSPGIGPDKSMEEPDETSGMNKLCQDFTSHGKGLPAEISLVHQN